MDLPEQSFFEKIDSSMVAIVCGDIYIAREPITRAIGHIFHHNGINYKLEPEPSGKSLVNYDEDYYLDNEGFKEAKNKELTKRIKSIKEENQKNIEALESDVCLSFIENLIFPEFNAQRKKICSSAKEVKIETPENELKRLMLLDEFFRTSHYLVLGKEIYTLEETDNQCSPHVMLFGKKYSLSRSCLLEEFAQKYYGEYESRLKDMLVKSEEAINELNQDKQRLARLKKDEYSEPSLENPSICFGFKKYKGEWYVWKEIEPSAFEYKNNIFLFDKTKVGVRIPVRGDKIRTINIHTQEPIIFDESYIHPSLKEEKGFRIICYKGSNPTKTRKSLEDEFNMIYPDIKNEQELNAKWAAYIVKMGVSTLEGGDISEDVPVWHSLDRMVSEGYGCTRSKFEKWKEEKRKQGFNLGDPTPVG